MPTTEFIIKWINDAREAVKAGATADQLDRKFNKLEKSMQKQGKSSKQMVKDQKQVGKGFLGLSFSVKDFTKALARVAVVSPIWMIFRSIVQGITRTFDDAGKAFNEFQKEMGRVATVTTTVGATAEQFKDLEDAVVSFASSSTATLKDTATAMYQLGTAGLSVEESIAGFEHVMNLSIATMTDVNQTGKLVAGAFNLFGKEMDNTLSTAEKMQHVADVLATTFKTQQVELSEIATAFGFAANAANSINFSFEDLTATIGFLNTGMLKGSKSGTSLTNALIKMAKNADLLESATGKAFDPTKPIEFVDTMRILNKRFGEGKLALNDDVKLIQTFGIRGVRAVKSILQRWDEWEEALARNRGNVKDAAEDMRGAFEDNVGAQVEELGQKYGEMSTAIANKTTNVALPAIKSMNSSFGAIISLINKPDVEKFALAVSVAYSGSAHSVEEFLKEFDKVGSSMDRLDDLVTDSEFVEFINDLRSIGMKDAFAGLTLVMTGNFKALSTYYELLKKTREEEKKGEKGGKDPKRTIRTDDEFARDLKLLKAGGATNLDIAKETLYYYEIERDMAIDTNEVLKSRNKLQAEELKILTKQAKEFRNLVSSSLSEAFKEGDISSFTKILGERIKETIIDNVAEGMTNAFFNLTNLDLVFGSSLDGLKIQRAIIVGADYHANAIKTALTTGAGAGTQGLSTPDLSGLTIPTPGLTSMQTGMNIPIAKPGEFAAQGQPQSLIQKGKGLFDKMGGLGGLASMAGFGLLLSGGFGGQSSSGQAFKTSLGTETSKASTRSTTVAKVTNIAISPTFILDGASINDEETIRESAKKMAELMREDLMRTLEDEDVATGNV